MIYQSSHCGSMEKSTLLCWSFLVLRYRKCKYGFPNTLILKYHISEVFYFTHFCTDKQDHEHAPTASFGFLFVTFLQFHMIFDYGATSRHYLIAYVIGWSSVGMILNNTSRGRTQSAYTSSRLSFLWVFLYLFSILFVVVSFVGVLVSDYYLLSLCFLLSS